jgi:hypothetical protein
VGWADSRVVAATAERLRYWLERVRPSLLYQLIAVARLPGGGISEIAVNTSLAFIEGAKPQGEIECALVMQMACAHTASMAVLNRLGGGHGTDRSVTRRLQQPDCYAPIRPKPKRCGA